MFSMTGREFNQDTSAAKRASVNGPVFITDRGRLSHVLLTIDDYNRLSTRQNIADQLACPEGADIEFEPARLPSIFTPAQF